MEFLDVSIIPDLLVGITELDAEKSEITWSLVPDVALSIFNLLSSCSVDMRVDGGGNRERNVCLHYLWCCLVFHCILGCYIWIGIHPLPNALLREKFSVLGYVGDPSSPALEANLVAPRTSIPPGPIGKKFSMITWGGCGMVVS